MTPILGLRMAANRSDGKCSKASRVSIFRMIPGWLTTELTEPSLQIVDVRFRAHQGIANEMGLSSYELQRLDN